MDSLKRRLMQAENALKTTNKKLSSVCALISFIQERIQDIEEVLPFSSIDKL